MLDKYGNSHPALKMGERVVKNSMRVESAGGQFSHWACEGCGVPARIIYIATGHDHTDEHYYVCTCPVPKSVTP